jgi:hypothetical protein
MKSVLSSASSPLSLERALPDRSADRSRRRIAHRKATAEPDAYERSSLIVDVRDIQ